MNIKAIRTALLMAIDRIEADRELLRAYHTGRNGVDADFAEKMERFNATHQPVLDALELALLHAGD